MDAVFGRVGGGFDIFLDSGTAVYTDKQTEAYHDIEFGGKEE